MLAAKYRLTGKKNFERVEKEGRLFQSASFGLAFCPREDEEISCFAAVVSKKISNDSTQRNRISRAFFEAVRQNWPDIRKGFDVVLLAKPTALRNSTEIIMKEVIEALRQAGLAR